MFQTMYLDERVALTPAEMNLLTDQDSIKSMLENKLREMNEGKCNANGFVKPGSLKLLGRSMGAAENGRFTGNLLFDCKIACDILYPTVGSVLKANVVKVNRMGAYAVYEDAIRILLPRDLHIGSDTFDNIKEGDNVEVKLDRSRFQTNDVFIMAVGRLHHMNTAPILEQGAVIEAAEAAEE